MAADCLGPKMTDDQIKKISTHRLLKIFRQVRSSIWGREPERPWDEYDYAEEELFDKLKKELDGREHLERKHTKSKTKKNRIRIKRIK